MKSRNIIFLNSLKEKNFRNHFNQPDISIFQSYEMYLVWSNVKNYLPFFTVVENENGEIIASLLAVIQKEHTGLLGVFSSRSIVIGMPLFPKGNYEALDELLMRYNSYISKNAIYSQFRNLNEYSEQLKEVFIKNGFEYKPHLDIIHSLKTPIEEQFAKLHKGRRKNIRRVERADVIFRSVLNGNEFNIAYELIVSTYKRVKLPMPDKSLFYESYYQLSKKNILNTFVAVSNEEIIGCRMVLCYGDIIYDWYAGASEKHLDKYPNDFLPWKVIEWGSNNGYKYFDFGGAGKPNVPYGVRDHKLKFGGELVEYGRFEKVHNKLLLKIAEFGLKLYRYIK